MPAAAILQVVLPIVVPMVLSLFRYFFPNLPPVTLPVAAPMLGAGAGAAVGFDPAHGAMLGLAGVGVREVVDQAIKHIRRTGGPKPMG